MAEEFFSFETALRELQMREEELKRLVSAGEIRAFRDGDQMKLRREDVERLRRREEEEGEVVDLGADLASEEAPGMATAQISEADTLLPDEDETLEEAITLPETAAPSAAATARARPRAVAGRPAEAGEEEGMGLRVAIVATTILLVLAAFVAHGAANVDASGIAGMVADIVRGMMSPA